MGLLTKEVEVVLGVKNIKHYEDLGYNLQILKNKRMQIPRNTKIIVNTEDLTDGSNVAVKCECDGCFKEIKDVKWNNYKRYVKEDGKYYCKKCADKLYTGEKISKARLKNGKSFEQWCFDNYRQDVLDRWDCELNTCKPNEINFATKNKYYFKCPNGIHKSELKIISSFTSANREGSISCKACNSFAQWGINNICKDFLEKYWDYIKNIVDPWEISYGANEPKVWIKCQEKEYHESYDILCVNFINEQRCSYCHVNSINKIHNYDSLGYLYPKASILWSIKNKTTPYQYTPKSNQYVYWKCPEGKHADFKRQIAKSSLYEFRCPDCQCSLGELAIDDVLLKHSFVKISQEDYNKLIDKNENYFIPQKTFDGLVGLGGGLLSYDHYLPKYNLLVEYQGEYHDGTARNQTEEAFIKQVEHDRRKKEYAENKKIRLLEIWYYEFDNIEEILTKELNSLKDVLPIS